MAKKKEPKKAAVETRHDEVRYTTGNPHEMLGKYLAANLLRGWTEDFVDEDTGDVVTIERNEIIEQRGELIDGELLARIQFHIQAGDISEVEVSNQKRLAYMGSYANCWPYSVTAEINGKKRRFLLYATSVYNALEIAQDYIELNFDGVFEFKQVKIFDYCIFIKDNLKRVEDDKTQPDPDKEFYKIEVEVLQDEIITPYTFVLQTKDVDTGMIVINNWIAEKIKEQIEKAGRSSLADYSVTVKAGVIIPCYRIIDKEFSDAYINQKPQ